MHIKDVCNDSKILLTGVSYVFTNAKMVVLQTRSMQAFATCKAMQCTILDLKHMCVHLVVKHSRGFLAVDGCSKLISRVMIVVIDIQEKQEKILQIQIYFQTAVANEVLHSTVHAGDTTKLV